MTRLWTMLARLATLAVVTVHFMCICCAQDSLDRSETGDAKPPSIDELLLFFPSKYPVGNWTPKDLRFEDVSFSAEDKTRLHGWYCPCENPRATILIAHGNAGNVASRAPWLKYLQSQARVATFMFDYRGYDICEDTEGGPQQLADQRLLDATRQVHRPPRLRREADIELADAREAGIARRSGRHIASTVPVIGRSE